MSGGVENTSSRIQLAVECKGLKAMDYMSKSDPCCVLYTRAAGRGSAWVEHSRTEKIDNNHDPVFSKSFELTYNFELEQPVMFKLYDLDNDTSSIHDDDPLGEVITTLGNIAGSTAQVFQAPLTVKGSRAGLIKVTMEEMADSNLVCDFDFCARKLDNMDGWFSKSDPYLKISRLLENGSWMPCHQTETINNNLNPTWKPFTLSHTQLCNCDRYRPLKLEVWDFDTGDEDDLIGIVETSLDALLAWGGQGQGGEGLPIISPTKKAKSKKYVHSGTLHLNKITERKVLSFLEFIKGGCELNCMVCVDFTGSNGDPRSPSSLHYMNEFQQNQYQAAMLAVSSILAPYDHDGQFPCFGFGARVDGVVSHCFPLNGNPAAPEVDGVAGIMSAYKECLARPGMVLSGPTCFTPMLNYAASRPSAKARDGKSYLVALILTDGEITDMQSTVDTIVRMSPDPVSIIIVGVGNGCDFAKMDQLDGDGHALRGSNGKACERDIVQFIPYRQYVGGDPSQLAADTLKEVPGQLLGFMAKHKISPGNPPPPPPPPAYQDEGAGAGAEQSRPPPPAYN